MNTDIQPVWFFADQVWQQGIPQIGSTLHKSLLLDLNLLSPSFSLYWPPSLWYALQLYPQTWFLVLSASVGAKLMFYPPQSPVTKVNKWFTDLSVSLLQTVSPYWCSLLPIPKMFFCFISIPLVWTMLCKSVCVVHNQMLFWDPDNLYPLFHSCLT